MPAVVSGPFVFVAGQVPLDQGQAMWTGVLGRDVSIEEGQRAARRCGLQALSILRATLGSLDDVARIAKLTVFVASADGFHDQPKVANGASELFAEVFGDVGRHARSAVGVSGLPLGVPVEVEVIAEFAGTRTDRG